MLPCSPYIHNICQSVQLGDEEVATLATGVESLEKKETIVTVTDVTSVKVDLFSFEKVIKKDSHRTHFYSNFQLESICKYYVDSDRCLIW